MKKYVVYSILFVVSLTSFGQFYGMGFKNPKEALNNLDYCDRHLLYECSELVGVPIDSMIGVDDIFNTEEFLNTEYTVKVAIRSNIIFYDEYTKDSTDTILETYLGSAKLDKPRFMVFILKKEKETKVTLQMYY